MTDIHTSVGHSVDRLDAADKVTGEAQYVDDLYRPGMLHGAILGSTHAHAKIRGYKLDAALAIAGLYVVADAFSHVDEYVNEADGIGQALSRLAQAYFLRLPSFLAPVAPVAMLVGAAHGIAQLSGRNEINAMKASGLSFWYRSTVNRVEHALNTPAREPMSAERRPATTIPRSPGGSRNFTISGNAAWHSAGTGLPSAPTIDESSGIFPLLASAKQIRPGMMNR